MWDELYAQHYPELLRYAVSACHSREQAEDLAQEAFLKALQNADTFEDLGPSQRRAWLFRTLKNLMCDKYRRAALEAAFVQELQEDAVAPERGYERAETELVLSKLSSQDRALFQMRYLEGYNAQELAEIFHLPPGTVRSRLSRCRKYLKEIFSE